MKKIEEKIYNKVTKPRWFVSENTHFITIECGWGNGYVCIPKFYSFYGKHYDEIDDLLSEHNLNNFEWRGLTFSQSCSNTLQNSLLGKKIPAISKEQNHWIIRFDTTHSSQNKSNYPKEKVIELILDLREKVFKLQQKLS